MQIVCSFTVLLGRLCLCAIFILSGIGKFLDHSTIAGYMAAKGMTMIPLFLYAAAIIEILGGLALLLGYKARCAAGILALYLIPVTLIFHDFWNLADGERQLQMIMFLKNLAIFGGLLYVVGCGAGKCACDTFCCQKTPETKP